MTTTTWVLLAAFLAIAVVDWVAVARGAEGIGVRRITKPGCMLPLIAAAVLVEGPSTPVRLALVAALVLSLAGDVLLLRDEVQARFVAGLGSFLLAHVAYVVAFLLRGVEAGGLAIGVLAVAVVIGVVGRRVLRAVRTGDEPELAVPVGAYVAVISAMVLVAVGTADPRAGVGAVLFAGSDSLIAWERFVEARPWMGVAVISAYHVAQGLLVLSFT